MTVINQLLAFPRFQTHVNGPYATKYRITRKFKIAIKRFFDVAKLARNV